MIIGHSELALELLDPQKSLYSSMQEIQKAAFRSADLTRQLLAFARKQTVAPKVLDLNETVEGMLKMLRRLIGENIDLVWLPAQDLWPVKMDPSQIDQILANLCVNARDAIAKLGKITIETQRATFDKAYCANHSGVIQGDFVMLAVSDDGRGLDKETLEKIFEPFFTTKEMGKGTGLGLATVYGVVKQNNGFINVYSKPGQGTTFKIYLPRHAANGEQMRKERPGGPEAQGGETVLLVEDEAANLKITRLILERLGYRVLVASTSDEAFAVVKKHLGEIDLLLTDRGHARHERQRLGQGTRVSLPWYQDIVHVRIYRQCHSPPWRIGQGRPFHPKNRLSEGGLGSQGARSAGWIAFPDDLTSQWVDAVPNRTNGFWEG